MRAMLRMKRDVGGNLVGEVCGFEEEQAHALVQSGHAELVAVFDPETQRFDPLELTVIDLAAPPATDPAPPPATDPAPPPATDPAPPPATDPAP